MEKELAQCNNRKSNAWDNMRQHEGQNETRPHAPGDKEAAETILSYPKAYGRQQAVTAAQHRKCKRKVAKAKKPHHFPHNNDG